VRRAAESSGSLVQIDFQDQGGGIDPAAAERIFEPGFTTKAGSPGLGLSVCKKVVEQHAGTIRVLGSAQPGSTFSVMLPLRKGSA
jgi:signal transduction histidine kinase